MEFNYNGTILINKKHLAPLATRLMPEINVIREAVGTGYTSEYSSINLPTDEKISKQVIDLVAKKKEKNISTLIVIGIGGSNLGTMAIQEALQNSLFSTQSHTIKIYYADTVDVDYISSLIRYVECELQQGRNVLLNVVTKSGTTIETIANFECLLSVLMHYHPHDYNDYVVITTDRDSVLWHYAEQQRCAVLEVPKKVGGRYSVLSAVGLFPLAMIGIDIIELLHGAHASTLLCVQDDIEQNPAALSALIKYSYYKEGININDLFFFDRALEAMGKWYRQLMGESIGKEYDRAGNKVEVGITPTVSIGSTDLHSVGQLYLGGPRDKYITFVSVLEHNNVLNVPLMPIFEKLFATIQKKSLSSIMNAILEGVKKVYITHERPFSSIILPSKSAFYIGQFLQMSMIEIMYLGYLLDINPFDQPQVELYKEETRKILAHE